MNKEIGRISKLTGNKALVEVYNQLLIKKISIINQTINYVSIGSLIGTKLVDGRTLVLTVEEILNNNEIYITTSICGIYDNTVEEFRFGTNTYPIINEKVFLLETNILNIIFDEKNNTNSIGTYVYNKNVNVSYNPNVLFGKHLGVFGNTGSGKTCTIVSIIQNYIRNNPKKNIKFIIFDVNNEYKDAFNSYYTKYIAFDKLVANHNILSISEYGKLFRASEGVQFPALKSVISNMSNNKTKTFDINDLEEQLDNWVIDTTPSDKSGNKDIFSKNSINNFLRTMILRINTIIEDVELMNVINNKSEENTIIDFQKDTKKKILVINLQVSSDVLDIILFILFKQIYQYRIKAIEEKTQYCLVLEEAHRYINNNVEESKLGNYYIDKLAREGRKFGIGLIISSQVPSMLSYEIVSQCNSVIMHKITSKKDMEFLRGVMRISNDTFYYQMNSLEKQHAIVCGEAFKNDSLVKIHTANPLPRSNDPIIKDAFE